MQFSGHHIVPFFRYLYFVQYAERIEILMDTMRVDDMNSFISSKNETKIFESNVFHLTKNQGEIMLQ